MTKIAWAIFLTAFFLLRPFMMQQNGLWYQHDDYDYFAHSTSIAFGQFPSYEKEYFTILSEGPQSSIGAGLLASPFVFVFSLIDRWQKADIVVQRTAENIPGSWSQYGFVFGGCVYFSLACFFLYIGLRFFFSHRFASLAIILTCLCQGMPLYVFRRPIFSHCYEFFLQAVLVFIFLKSRARVQEEKRIDLSILVGLLSGLIFLVRYNNVLFALMWPFLIHCRRIKELALMKTWKNLFVCFFSLGILVLVFKIWPDWYNHYQPYGWAKRYLLQIFSPGFYIRRVWHILFWCDWGLIYTAPTILLGLYSIGIFRFRLKKAMLLSLLPLLVNFYIIVIWRSQGAWYGYRFFVASAFPLVVFPVALFLQKTEEKFHRKLGFLWGLLVFVPVLSMLLFEGNYSDLNLIRTVQYFGYRDFGNDLYMMSVWRTFLFKPLECLKIIFQGGGLYTLYLLSRLAQGFGLWPTAYFRNYPQFEGVLLFRVVLLYVVPFVVGWFLEKAYLKRFSFLPDDKEWIL